MTICIIMKIIAHRSSINTGHLPYSDIRTQLSKMPFLVNEQNVSVMYIHINAISLRLDLNIFQQDECFCSKIGLDVYAKSNAKTSLSQIWVICHLLPFVRVGQFYGVPNWNNISRLLPLFQNNDYP